jgi:hypothetical protein
VDHFPAWPTHVRSGLAGRCGGRLRAVGRKGWTDQRTELRRLRTHATGRGCRGHRSRAAALVSLLVCQLEAKVAELVGVQDPVQLAGPAVSHREGDQVCLAPERDEGSCPLTSIIWGGPPSGTGRAGRQRREDFADPVYRPDGGPSLGAAIVVPRPPRPLAALRGRRGPRLVAAGDVTAFG